MQKYLPNEYNLFKVNNESERLKLHWKSSFWQRLDYNKFQQ